jgi:hypothetical protein
MISNGLYPTGDSPFFYRTRLDFYREMYFIFYFHLLTPPNLP